MQLKIVREKYWSHHPPETLLKLHYRKREENPALALSNGGNRSQLISSLSLTFGAPINQIPRQEHLRYLPRKPPMWVPKQLATDCSGCGKEFGVLARSTAIGLSHCRNCGKCFCTNCCSERITLPEFGYMKPVKCCRNCRDSIQLKATLRSLMDSSREDTNEQ
ncbi:hypothetical protein FGO68_gene3603 [Halteria grandinella]|uniref:FYVE-type domain-containing protein n=1 Tax=Halteria grandinella TaxID=5974 RepID=A0A8J8T8B8_HALGN|nr:hypothetical protein FGO68_gene3603 [Halteria grandinella]